MKNTGHLWHQKAITARGSKTKLGTQSDRFLRAVKNGGKENFTQSGSG